MRQISAGGWLAEEVQTVMDEMESEGPQMPLLDNVEDMPENDQESQSVVDEN